MSQPSNLHVTGKFLNSQPERCQSVKTKKLIQKIRFQIFFAESPLAEASRHFSGERLHRRNIYNLKLVSLDHTLDNMALDFVQNSHHSNIRLAGTRRRANQHVFARSVRRLEHKRLNAVERFKTTERKLCNR
jgi:hypothetical protein